MTEIEIERRRSSGAWKWIVALLVVAAIGAGAWWYLSSGEVSVDQEPTAEQVRPEPVRPAPGAEPGFPDTTGAQPLSPEDAQPGSGTDGGLDEPTADPAPDDPPGGAAAPGVGGRSAL